MHQNPDKYNKLELKYRWAKKEMERWKKRWNEEKNDLIYGQLFDFLKDRIENQWEGFVENNGRNYRGWIRDMFK